MESVIISLSFVAAFSLLMHEFLFYLRDYKNVTNNIWAELPLVIVVAKPRLQSNYPSDIFNYKYKGT